LEVASIISDSKKKKKGKNGAPAIAFVWSICVFLAKVASHGHGAATGIQFVYASLSHGKRGGVRVAGAARLIKERRA
jgi:hypothetical protein